MRITAQAKSPSRKRSKAPERPQTTGRANRERRQPGLCADTVNHGDPTVPRNRLEHLAGRHDVRGCLTERDDLRRLKPLGWPCCWKMRTSGSPASSSNSMPIHGRERTARKRCLPRPAHTGAPRATTAGSCLEESVRHPRPALKELQGAFILSINMSGDRKLFARASFEEVELLYTIAGGRGRLGARAIISGRVRHDVSVAGSLLLQ